MRKLADDKAGEYLVGRSETKRLQGCAVIEREETHAEEKEKSKLENDTECVQHQCFLAVPGRAAAQEPLDEELVCAM